MEAEQNALVNTQLVEYTGLFGILNSNRTIVYGLDIFQLLVKVQLCYFFITLFSLMSSMYYCSKDLNIVLPYLLIFVLILTLSLFNFHLIEYSDNIWSYMLVKNNAFLSFSTPNEVLLKSERSKYKTSTIVVLILWTIVFLAWVCSPFLQLNSYRSININNMTYHYHFTPLNSIFPVTDYIFNKYFILIYFLEAIAVFFCCHSLVLFTFLIFTICISVECQLKRIASLYSTFNFMERHINSKQYLLQYVNVCHGFI